jgi:thioredoxin-like negative regulator of GroEL
MKTSIVKALQKEYSYAEYRKLIVDLLQEDKVTGIEQSEDLLNYSALNETRMHRLDKTIAISDENIVLLQSLKNNYIWLVLSEGWCGDAAQILPVLNKMALASSGKIELKIVLRDENEELMNLFLTNGSKSVPKLIVLEKASLNVEANWGPRPLGAVHLIQDYKEKHGRIDETVKTDLQLWYLHDKGISTQNEIINLMLDIER